MNDEPIIDSYYNIVYPVVHNFEDGTRYRSIETAVAKYLGNGNFKYKGYVYGKNGHTLLNYTKWKPNWFWKILGYI